MYTKFRSNVPLTANQYFCT